MARADLRTLSALLCPIWGRQGGTKKGTISVNQMVAVEKTKPELYGKKFVRATSTLFWGPFLTHACPSSATGTRAVCCALPSAHAYWMLIGGCYPML